MKYNGGEPGRYIFIDENGNSYVVGDFIAIKEEGPSTDICMERNIDLFKEEWMMPKRIIPFANEAGGDVFCFSIKEGEEGSIYYWSHESMNQDDKNYWKIADSMEEFIDGMIPNAEE